LAACPTTKRQRCEPCGSLPDDDGTLESNQRPFAFYRYHRPLSLLHSIAAAERKEVVVLDILEYKKHKRNITVSSRIWRRSLDASWIWSWLWLVTPNYSPTHTQPCCRAPCNGHSDGYHTNKRPVMSAPAAVARSSRRVDCQLPLPSKPPEERPRRKAHNTIVKLSPMPLCLEKMLR